MSHTTQLSAVEQEYNCLSDRSAGAVTPVSSIPYSSQRRRNPHTALECPLLTILLHRGRDGGGREKSQWGLAVDTNKLWIFESPGIFSLFLLGFAPRPPPHKTHSSSRLGNNVLL